MSDRNRSRVPTAASEAEAEAGCVTVSTLGVERRLSDALAWVEDGVFAIRSTEFDLLAEAEDFREAIDLFAARTFDYAVLLSDLIEGGKATEDEEGVFRMLSARIMPLLRALERAEQRRSFRFPRLRNTRSGHWRHRGTQASGSSRLSAA